MEIHKIVDKHVFAKQTRWVFPELFPLFKGPGRALPALRGPGPGTYGPEKFPKIRGAHMDPKNPKEYIKDMFL